MIHRKPQPRPPSNHTASILLPNLLDVVTPPPAPPSASQPAVSKRKFLDLYSSTVKKKTRVLIRKPENVVTEDGKPQLQILGGRSDVEQGQENRRIVGDEEEDWSIPSDTKIALELMRSQFPKLEKGGSVRPFVLRSQLYSSVPDRTLVDRELERLKLERAVRIFKLNTGQDDYAVMFTADYLAQIELAKTRKNHEVVFDWFVQNFLPAHADAGVSHSRLVELLSQGGDVEDRHVSLLMNAGLLTRQLVDSTAYWLAIPNVGFLLKSLAGGRKEIVSFLSRRKYREMLQVPLERRRLQYSVLGMRFHIRDLLGLGQIHSVPSPSGPIIRLSRD